MLSSPGHGGGHSQKCHFPPAAQVLTRVCIGQTGIVVKVRKGENPPNPSNCLLNPVLLSHIVAL